MAKDLETLKADTAKALASSDDVLACSKAYQETVLEDMETLRKSADEAEALIPDESTSLSDLRRAVILHLIDEISKNNW